ncbi:hypothetical protein QYE76_061434 [Lolium multiflorum]|uniref:Uncharacterized protein n=1 Tax=Lolium multiflorum TaxID=4521 RepID=A0AAD8S1L2_LOLMU|nr:hypothetical protein QYE76_061434 [Lolium multiflorum]
MVPQSGSTSVLGHTYGVDDDVLLPVPAGSGSSRSSSESRQHDGVVAVVVENSGRASPMRCGKEFAKRPTIDALAAKVEVLEAENESLKKFLKESSEEETKKKKELLERHTQELSDLAEKLKKSQQRIQTLATKNKNYEAEAEAIDKMIFPSLGFEWTKDATLKRAEAYEEAQSSIDNLFEACREVAKSLSLKRAGTAVIDTMTKLIKQVPELIKDWQESSSAELLHLCWRRARRTSQP